MSLIQGGVLAGRYRLHAEIGRGGQGAVWRATDALTGREVAVKRLRPEYGAEPRLRRRLRREARAVGRLEHPNIVRLFEVGEDEAGPFFVMEWVPGVPLFRVDDLDVPRILDLCEQILGALAYAHARGVVHRDLKPENVLVHRGADGVDRVKLLDFGFAWVDDDLDEEISLAAKDVFGTPQYMAPEQAMREDDVGPSADLYAVGIIAWELICGAPPFTGPTGASVLMQQVNAPLPPLAPRPGFIVPPDLAAWLHRALAKDPAERFHSAGQMRRVLLALDGHPEPTLEHLDPMDPTDASLAGDPDLSVEISGVDLAPGTLGTGDAPLVGRDALQRWLWTHVVEVCGDHGGLKVVMLEGEPGLGRTRLCGWLTQTLAEGGWMTVAAGRHQQGVQSGLRAALRQALALDRRPPRRAASLGPTLATLGITDLDPALVLRFLYPETGSLPPARARRVVERLARSLAARRPLLLCLDDVHRAWGEDLDLVEHLVVALGQRPAPVLIVLTRPSLPLVDQPTAGEARVAALLKRRQEGVEGRRLARLAPEDVETLVQQALLVDPAVARRVAEAARGNPLLALTGLTWLLEVKALAFDEAVGLHRFVGIPPAIPTRPLLLMAERIDVALGRLPEGAALRTLAEHLALLGDAFTFRLAHALAAHLDVPEARLVNALDTLVRLGILEDRDDDVFAFRNAITRDALLQAVAAGRDPGAAHGAVARAKSAWLGDAAGLAAAEIARHHLAAEEVEPAVRCQLQAAEHARRSLQPKVALALFAEAERWLAAEPGAAPGALRADVLVGLAEVALSLGQVPRALRIAERISEWAQARGDDARGLQADILRGEALAASGNLGEADRLLATAAQQAEDRRRPGETTRIALARGRIAARRGDFTTARRAFQLAASAAATAGDRRGEAAGQQALGELWLKLGDREPAWEALTLAAELARDVEDEPLRAAIHLRLGELERKAGHAEAARPHYEAASEAFDTAGNPSGVGRSQRGLGDALWALGRPEARAAYARAIDSFSLQDDDFQLAVCFTQLGRVALEAGDNAEAEAAFDRASQHLEPLGDPPRQGLLHAFRAQAASRRQRAAARDLHLHAARQIDLRHPLLFSEWAAILRELAPLIAPDEPALAEELERRAAEVEEALAG
ncbi:MAG: protein kinase [Myxococcales bacterium]|nr:protein kinase [Myxococcales bacterium]